MASEQWIAGLDVINTVKSLIAGNFPLLAQIDDEILIIFKEKASKVGDSVVAGKTSKANALLALVGEIDYKFVLTLAGDEWQSMGDPEREALLFHHLCRCGAEENPQTGVLRTFIKIPDVSFFREEVEKYGFWRTSGTTPEPNLIADLFGSDAPANAKSAAVAPAIGQATTSAAGTTPSP